MNKYKLHVILVSRTGKYVNRYGFCSLREIYQTNVVKKLDTATKTGLDAAKTTSKKVIYKTTEATGELIANQ